MQVIGLAAALAVMSAPSAAPPVRLEHVPARPREDGDGLIKRPKSRRRWKYRDDANRPAGSKLARKAARGKL